MRLLCVCLAMLFSGFLAAGCQGDATQEEDKNDPEMPCQGLDCPPQGHQYATRAIQLPDQKLFAIDIDGDGRPDNQLRSVVRTIAAAGFDLDAQLAAALAAGSGIVLAEVRPLGLASGPVTVSLHSAAPPMPGAARPRFDGTDRFAVLPGQVPTLLSGRLEGNQLQTLLPREQTTATLARFELRLPVGGAVLPLTAYGVHLQGTISPQEITEGELHGVVRAQDIEAQVIPAIAALVTFQINHFPMAQATESIVRLLEDPGHPVTQRKCMVARDCCQRVADRPTCKILPEEVRDNPVVAAVLRPDVQVFDGDQWRPIPGGANKNALSLGIGYTAVKARFQ
ncbi:MAG: hypothetical protein NZ890_11305 [Myxococcota bacterium]|nr:hypothetical protein [Myxococcota bacterium]